MRLFALLPIAFALSACSALPGKQCDISDCSRPVSNSHQIVIWWGKGMRDGLPNSEQASLYTLIPE